MTDPVDTDALRNLSRWLYEESRLTDSTRVAITADELDRLRLSDWNATTQRDQLANALRRSDNENDRLRAKLDIVGAHDMHLRAVIENAPQKDRDE